MSHRSHPFLLAPDALKALTELDVYVASAGLSPSLVELIRIRTSQLNNCAYCVETHVKQALDSHEDPRRLGLLSTWRESSVFDARERAALAWSEAVTLISAGPVGDDIYAEAVEQFSEADLVRLTVAVAAINAWNLLAVSFNLSAARSRAARVRNDLGPTTHG
ncbi:carboxymuconolactone decarboxylase family protein [Brevundimonas sp. TWP2-3-4b1]|uniref:carboxymuconolactone decarboxylase family protein n=1 Tax=Brevundimonas sp. TWP2-3-4b1 TaxID=2804580 RepID=UPI003CEBF7C5